jgi:hypothetical protein
MYITLSNIQNGERVPLNPVIDNREGDFKISLTEIIYYPAWSNVSADLGNNTFNYGAETVRVPDGYYDICSLNNSVFIPQKLELKYNFASGKVSIHNLKKPLDLGLLGKTLGFINSASSTADGVATGDTFPKLILYKEIFIHLDEGLSTSQNIHNHHPSTLLRMLPVKTEECNGGRAESFNNPQYRRLENGPLNGIILSVRDAGHRLLPVAHLSCVLEIRRPS